MRGVMVRFSAMIAIAMIASLAIGSVVSLPSAPAYAGDKQGDFMVRVGVSVVDPDSDADVFSGGSRLSGADADVSTKWIPSATLTYFFTKNLAAELFCCFSKHDIDGKGSLHGADLGDTWIFPPVVTLQYHFDSMYGFKPYVGAGVQYIYFFDESRSSTLGNAKLDIDDAWGFTIQAGVDFDLGQGWYWNADIKKTWLDTDAHWKGTGIRADVDIDPLIISTGIGYRFNLSSLLGGRSGSLN